jgi:hypothetical protein
MKVTVLGCGNAFSTRNGNACFILEEEDVANPRHTPRKMLVDAGWALPYMLKENNIDIKEITDVYISHAHADHIGGLEFLGFSRYDWVGRPIRAEQYTVPDLIANAKLMEDVWYNSLRGGMSSLEGLDANLDTYFYMRPIDPNQTFVWCGWTCKLIQQIHIMTGSIITNTFGLFMERENHPTIYFVTDSQHCSPRQIEIFYRKADVIFQDCECIGVDTENKVSKFMSGVHANYAQLAGWESANSAKLPIETKNKMWLTHYQDFVSDNRDMFGKDCNWNYLAEQDGFKGFVKVGQTFDF